MNEETKKIIVTILEIISVAIIAFVILLFTGKSVKTVKLPVHSKNSHVAKLRRNKFNYMDRQC